MAQEPSINTLTPQQRAAGRQKHRKIEALGGLTIIVMVAVIVYVLLDRQKKPPAKKPPRQSGGGGTPGGGTPGTTTAPVADTPKKDKGKEDKYDVDKVARENWEQFMRLNRDEEPALFFFYATLFFMFVLAITIRVLWSFKLHRSMATLVACTAYLFFFVSSFITLLALRPKNWIPWVLWLFVLLFTVLLAPRVSGPTTRGFLRLYDFGSHLPKGFVGFVGTAGEVTRRLMLGDLDELEKRIPEHDANVEEIMRRLGRRIEFSAEAEKVEAMVRDFARRKTPARLRQMIDEGDLSALYERFDNLLARLRRPK